MNGPLWPGVGRPKQEPLMNWPSFNPERGSQSSVGCAEMSGEPVMIAELSPTDFSSTVPSGSFVPAGSVPLRPKLLDTADVMATPLCTWVIPETCQPFRKRPAAL